MKRGHQLWICGRNAAGSDPARWSVLGVFSTRGRAAARCRDELYFIGPLYLDEPLPDEIIPWPGAERPALKT